MRSELLGNKILIRWVLLAVLAGLLVTILPPLYVVALVSAIAIAYLAIRRPHWVMFALLISKASLDNLSQTVTFFENTPLSVNVNGLLNVAVVLWALVAVAGGYVSLRKMPVTRPYLSLLAIGVLGLVVSHYRSDTIREWFRLASPFAVYILVWGIARRRAGIGWFVWLIALSAIVPMIVGAYQIISGTGFDISVGFNRAYATFWYPSSFSFYLLIVLLLTIPQLQVSKNWSTRIVLASLIGMCFLSLLVTYTRSAWIGFALAVGCLGLIYYRKLLLIGLGLVLVVFLTVPSVRQRFADLGTAETFSLEGNVVGASTGLGAVNSFQWRLILWHDTLPFVAASPLVGNGLGSFANLAATTRIGISIAAHNDYLRILVETGIVGLVVFLWLHAKVLQGAWQVYRKYQPKWQSMFAVAFIGLYVAILAVSFTDNILSYHTVGWYVWAYAAAVHQL